jgi:dTDP-4-dehydrorhamnose reductase
MITLIGHGYIGTHVHNELNEQGLKHNWISHKDDIPLNTSYIINCAGYTGVPNVDACEKNKQETIEGNVLFPLSLERNNSVKIMHISSGCVYTGYKEGGWLETDTPNFNFNNASFYSATKALFQELVTPYMHKSYLMRVRMPFCSENNPKSLLTKLSKYDKLIDKENSVSCVYDIAKVAVFFYKERPEYGIYNLCNTGSTTTRKISDKMGLTKEWFTDEQFKDSVIAPRSNCVLNTNKLEAVYKIRSTDNALDECIKNENRI